MRLNVRTKLLGGFLVVIAMLLVVFGISWNGLTSMAAATDFIVHEALPEDQEVRDLELQLALQTELYFEYAITLDHEVLEEAREQTDIILEESAQLEGQLAGEPEMLQLLLHFEDQYDEFLLEAEVFAAHYAAGETAEGLEALHVMVAEEEQMEAGLAELAHEVELGIEEAFAAAESTEKSAIQLIVAVSIIASLTAMIIGFLLSRSISNGVTSVGRAMRQIALGDVTVQVDNNSADEIGDMARSYKEMQEYLQKISKSVQQIGQGDLSVDVEPQSEKDVLGNALIEMVSNLREMSQLVEQVGDGDLTVDVKPRSEKDALGNALSGMVDNLRVLVGQVQDTSGNLTSASGQLSNAADQAGRATEGVASASQQLAKGAEEQNQGVNQTNISMQQLSAAIEQIAKGSQEQATSVERTSNISSQVSKAIGDMAQSAQSAADGSSQATQAAGDGKKMVDQTIEGMGKIRGAVELVAQQITDLGNQSEEIGKIVAVIDDIAAQTNLLALNAAIEAARAGEQGRGFAVVADEVRGLAERVTGATKEIAALVDNIQNGVAESIRAVDEGTKEVQEGVKLAEQAGEALNNIQTSVAGVAGQVEQISAAAEEVSASSDEMNTLIDGVSSVTEENSAATEQMAANSSEVSKSIEGIATISEQNSASTQEVSASAEQMGAQVQEMVASSQSLAQMAGDLQGIVSRFKLNSSNGSVAVKELSPKTEKAP